MGAGLLITYTIMLGDVLVGKAPQYNGFITNLANIHSGDLWYLDRRFVVRSAAAYAWQQSLQQRIYYSMTSLALRADNHPVTSLGSLPSSS